MPLAAPEKAGFKLLGVTALLRLSKLAPDTHTPAPAPNRPPFLQREGQTPHHRNPRDNTETPAERQEGSPQAATPASQGSGIPQQLPQTDGAGEAHVPWGPWCPEVQLQLLVASGQHRSVSQLPFRLILSLGF